MSLRKVGILLVKEFAYNSRSFIFVWAIAGPLLISLLLSLIFGALFATPPKLGIADEGSSRLVDLATGLDSAVVREYVSASGLKKGVEAGAVDMGVVLPFGFDDSVARGERVDITAYVWGESLARDRIILRVVVADLVRELAGQEAPVEIVATTLGDSQNIPWGDRIMPLIVLMAVLFGGAMVPATSLVNEKQKRTLSALTITPASLGDIFLAKGLLGVILSLFMGMLILAINQAFGAQPALLVLVLALGSVTAATFGVLLGVVMKNITTLFASVKFFGIFLYAPAIIYMFPQIPAWVGRIFPTYYIVQPVVEVSQQDAGWSEIALEVFVLVGLTVALFALVAGIVRRARRAEVWAT